MKISERIYNSSEVIAFRSTKEEFGGLSNMAPGYILRVNDVIIPSAEALYQACRYPLFPDIQQEIISQNSPMTAKMISRKYLSHSRQDWEEIKYTIMYWVLQVKLSQNFDNFSHVLKKTADIPIVELSTKDKDWAVIAENKNTLKGKNALGRLLMKLRSEFILENNDIDCVSPPAIYGFMLYGSDIETVCNPELELAHSLLFDLDSK
ncbi:NADAR family protein [Flavobacterium pectinovorum]|uniref:NADAR family protein n=1 Tax=Flavobacterium pectinovorum TaxID=29533 RepID=UPI001FAE45A8|nr:NADAR family protein [Flavobacterium pectinovorum]MCI9845949.1 NADAR family protein [Flavobacterium pectinovorum]